MSDDYVSREALKQALTDKSRIGASRIPTWNDAFDAVTNIPAADVVEVVRGKWIDTCVRDWTCSVCKGKIDKVRHVDGYYYKNLPNFCPDCGAKMDGGQDDV